MNQTEKEVGAKGGRRASLIGKIKVMTGEKGREPEAWS